MNIIKLQNKDLTLVKKFCDECRAVGYENNASISLLKWGGDQDLKRPPDFWALIINDEIASLSGSHYFGVHKEPDVFQLRCLFRSATLPRYSNIISGMSKNHMNSVPFSLLLPYQILHGLDQGYRHFYITTSSSEHDASGKMKRTHRALELLSKTRIVDFAENEIIYSTFQTKWEINLLRYYDALLKFSETRTQLGVTPDFDYENFKKLILQGLKSK